MEELKLAQYFLNDELESILSDKTLLENRRIRHDAEKQTQTEYSERFPLELLQNANDAQKEKGILADVVFHLTPYSLLIADNGIGFSPEAIESISTLAKSTKTPENSVGHKGIGFKSVLNITDNPQIFSNKITFEFSEKLLRDFIKKKRPHIDLSNAYIPTMEYPFSLHSVIPGDDSQIISDLQSKGFTTVVRLPFNQAPREYVLKCLLKFLNPEVMMFLDFVRVLRFIDSDSPQEVREISVNRELEFFEENLKISKVEIQTNNYETVSEWLMFERSIIIPDEYINLVSDIGKSWKNLSSAPISLAFKINENGIDTSKNLYFSSYFPTEASTELPFIINSKFFLTSDRTGISDTPKTRPLNEFILNSIVEFISKEIAVILSKRFPYDGSVVKAFRPTNTPNRSEIVDYFLRKLVDEIKSVKFVWNVTNSLISLNNSMRPPVNCLDDFKLEYFDLTNLNIQSIVHPSICSDITFRNALDYFGCEEIEFDLLLSRLVKPDEDHILVFYTRLISWSETISDVFLKDYFKDLRLIRTSGGSWAKPSENVFLPSKRFKEKFSMDNNFVDIPSIDLDSDETFKNFFISIGVQEWSWRPILDKLCFPVLSKELSIDDNSRSDALRLLYLYMTDENAGEDDSRIKRAGECYFASRDSLGNVILKHKATELYFGNDWEFSRTLENVLGPDNESDFVVNEFLQFDKNITSHAKIYEKFGVNKNLKLISARRGLPYPLDNLVLENEKAECTSKTRKGMYQVNQDTYLDRFDKIIEREKESLKFDSESTVISRLNNLAALIVDLYESKSLKSLQSSQSCNLHSSRCSNIYGHCTAWYQVRTHKWLPVIIDNVIVLKSPSEIYFQDEPTPPLVAEMLGELHYGIELSKSNLKLIGVKEISDTSLKSLTQLLHKFSQRNEITDDVVLSCSWIEKYINERIRRGEKLDSSIPLLSKKRGNYCFSTNPIVILNELLRSSWSGDEPFLINHELIDLIRERNLRVVEENPNISNVSFLSHEDFIHSRDEILDRICSVINPVLSVVLETEKHLLPNYIDVFSKIIVCPVKSMNVFYKIGDVEMQAISSNCFIMPHANFNFLFTVVDHGIDINLIPIKISEVMKNSKKDAIIQSFFDADEAEQVKRLNWYNLSETDLEKTSKEADSAINKFEKLNYEGVFAEPPFPFDTDLTEYVNRSNLKESTQEVRPPQISSSSVYQTESKIDDVTDIIDRSLNKSSRSRERGKSSLYRSKLTRKKNSAFPRDERRTHQTAQDNGEQAEKKVYELFEQAKTDGKIFNYKWVSKEDSRAGYDFWYEVTENNRTLVEVKSIASDRWKDQFSISKKEWETALEYKDSYEIWRVYSGGIGRIVNPASLIENNESDLQPKDFYFSGFDLKDIPF